MVSVGTNLEIDPAWWALIYSSWCGWISYPYELQQLPGPGK